MSFVNDFAQIKAASDVNDPSDQKNKTKVFVTSATGGLGWHILQKFFDSWRHGLNQQLA